MARTFYLTGTGRFSQAQDARRHASNNKKIRDFENGQIRDRNLPFGATEKNREGEFSVAEAGKLIPNGSYVRNQDGTRTKVTAANREEVINKLGANIKPSTAEQVANVGRAKAGEKINRGTIKVTDEEGNVSSRGFGGRAPTKLGPDVPKKFLPKAPKGRKSK